MNCSICGAPDHDYPTTLGQLRDCWGRLRLVADGLRARVVDLKAQLDAQGTWTSVDEALPDSKIAVLALWEDRGIALVAFFQDGKWQPVQLVEDNPHDWSRPSHWRYMPPPQKAARRPSPCEHPDGCHHPEQMGPYEDVPDCKGDGHHACRSCQRWAGNGGPQ